MCDGAERRQVDDAKRRHCDVPFGTSHFCVSLPLSAFADWAFLDHQNRATTSAGCVEWREQRARVPKRAANPQKQPCAATTVPSGEDIHPSDQ